MFFEHLAIRGLLQKCYRSKPLMLLIAQCVVLGSASLTLSGEVESLPSLPQALSADAELLSQLGFVHRILILENKTLEVIFERQLLNVGFTLGSRVRGFKLWLLSGWSAKC